MTNQNDAVLNRIKELEAKFDQAVQERANPDDFKDSQLILQELQVEAQKLLLKYTIYKTEVDLAFLKTYGNFSIPELDHVEARKVFEQIKVENLIFTK